MKATDIYAIDSPIPITYGELGLLTIDEAGTVTLTPDGEARILAVIEHARENERLLFKSISKQDLAVVQRALSKIIADLS